MGPFDGMGRKPGGPAAGRHGPWPGDPSGVVVGVRVAAWLAALANALAGVLGAGLSGGETAGERVARVGAALLGFGMAYAVDAPAGRGVQ